MQNALADEFVVYSKLDDLEDASTTVLTSQIENTKHQDTLSTNVGQRVFNYVAALIFLVILAPAMLCIMLIIKLDSPGPVFFRQPRIGLNNCVFRIWKFRTMHHRSSDTLGSQLTLRNDARVTRAGVWLRKFSLDELPQLFNVLTGEMSIVGPRPHPIEAKAGSVLYADAVPHYSARHRVLPGITGWAQVNGWRGQTETLIQIQKRVDYDIDYLRRKSIWFDCKIIFLTFCRVWVDDAF